MFALPPGGAHTVLMPQIVESETAGPRALVVDDDPEIVDVLCEFVEREGFVVARAGTLEEAREEIAGSPPDIVLVDINLPDGSGLDLLEGLEPADPEIVLITGHASVETAV